MRLVVCGEALIDLIPREVSAGSSETVWRALSGGGPMNTAVALARLGVQTHFLGRFGNDTFANQLRSHIAASGARLDLSVTTAEATSLAVVSLDDEGRANYTFHFADTANFGWCDEDFPDLTAQDWVHFGSIGAVLAPGHHALLRFIERTPAALSYDINVRPTVLSDREEYRWRVSALMTAVGAHQGIVKASDEDILLLSPPGSDVLAVAADWIQKFGLSLFVVTLGPEGAAAITPDGQVVRVPGHQVELIDTVGAGDTFMAGFLADMVSGPTDLITALSRGAGASAIVCSRQGANPPTKVELDAFLQ